MFIVVTVSLLFFTALILVILRFTRPEFRFSWLIAVGGGFIAWLSVFAWQLQMPLRIALPSWEPKLLFSQSPSFVADGFSWPFALSLTTLSLAIVLTAVARPQFPNPLIWASTMTLTGLGVVAVVADNPLALVMAWSAIDLVELVAQFRYVQGSPLNERVVIAFSARVGGVLLLLWANITSVATHQPMDFQSAPPQVGLYLLLAASLRLGVLPLHLPYPGIAPIRRGFGTGLRLISAASSLILLARIPSSSVISPFTPYLLVFTAFAGLYGGWMWLRAPDELTGRPFWMIGFAALAVAAALRANPVGATAWGCSLLLAGGALFLSSVQSVRLNRALLVGAFGLSSLPFSLTAGGWESKTPSPWVFWPFFLLAHAMLIAGFVRNALRPAQRDTFENQPIWARNVYPTGIGLLLITLLLLGFFGWEGSLRIGNWVAALITSLLTIAILWLTPRVRLLNPIRAHWVQPSSSWPDWIYRAIWWIYRQLGRLSDAFTSVLEGEGGIMWTLVFLALFISLFQRLP